MISGEGVGESVSHTDVSSPSSCPSGHLLPEREKENNVKDTRTRVLAVAKGWLGTPYVHQASAKRAGCDCLGLVRGVWRELYGTEPELPPPYTPDWNERAWNKSGRAEPLLDAARRNLTPVDNFTSGDVLIFRVMRDGPAKHCGIMTAPDRFIHAYAGRAVIESWFNRWWRARLAGAFAFPVQGTCDEAYAAYPFRRSATSPP